MAYEFDKDVVRDVAHRPWPLPRGPWLMTQTWSDLLFAHWRVSRAALRPLVPEVFSLDTFEEEAWIGLVPFLMSNVGLRGVPAPSSLSEFPELNVRTYVRVGDRPGVYFFSLDAASRLAVRAARLLLNLPYYAAEMHVAAGPSAIAYASRRSAPGRAARFQATYAPVGAPYLPVPGSLEHFLTERYCLYNLDRRGRPYQLDIHHGRWSLQAAHGDITTNSMIEAAGLARPADPPLLHFAKRQDAIAWAPARVTGARREEDAS